MSEQSIAAQLGISVDQLHQLGSYVGNLDSMTSQDSLGQDQIAAIQNYVDRVKANNPPVQSGGTPSAPSSQTVVGQQGVSSAPQGGSSGTSSQTAIGSQGVSTGNTSTSSGGIAGFLGGTDKYQVYTPNYVADPNAEANKAAVANQITNVQGQAAPTIQHTTVAPAAQSTAAQLPTDVRAGEMGLAGQLADQAAGKGPTLSDQQFKTDTDRGLAQSLAMAASARGVNPGQAMRQAADSQAAIQGQASAQQFTNSQQEQMNARSQLAGVLGQTGQQDTTAAGLAQQNSQFNATATNKKSEQQAAIDSAEAAANVNGQMDMTKFKDTLVQSYLSMGMTLDQANYQAQLQQQQFATSVVAQQIAAAHGVGIQAATQGAQLAGAGISAGGSALAAALAGGSKAAGAAGAAAGASEGVSAAEEAMMVL